MNLPVILKGLLYIDLSRITIPSCSLTGPKGEDNLSKIASLRRDGVYMELEYWIEVKQEIEKL